MKSTPKPSAPMFHPEVIPQAERLQAWADAGAPSQKGPNEGRQYFGLGFGAFYTMFRSFHLAAPDLSFSTSTGLGFNAKDGFRALVFAASVPGYYWVAVQHALERLQTDYATDTFPAVCSAKDVLPAIARWAPGIKFKWNSDFGATHTTLPYGWRVPERYVSGSKRLMFSIEEREAGSRVRVCVTTRTITRRPNTRILSVCARPSQLEHVLAKYPHPDAGWVMLSPKLLKLAYRWGAVHFHNRVLG